MPTKAALWEEYLANYPAFNVVMHTITYMSPHTAYVSVKPLFTIDCGSLLTDVKVFSVCLHFACFLS